MIMAGLAAIPAGAQERPASLVSRYLDPQSGLTIEEVVALALEHSPGLAAAADRLDEARARQAQAALRQNPTLSVDQKEQAGGSDRETAIGVAWPLELFRRSARVAVAEKMGGETAAGIAELRWHVAGDIRDQAGRLLVAVRLLEIAEQQAASGRETWDLAAGRAREGAAAPLERDVAEVEWRRLEAAVLRQRGAADAAMLSLKALAGLTPETPLLLRDSLEAVVERVLATAPAGRATGVSPAWWSARPDARRADAAIAVAHAQEELARREGRFDLSLTGGYSRSSLGFPELGLTSTGATTPIQARFHNVSFGAMVVLPWANRNQGAVQAAAAASRAAGHDREAAGIAAQSEYEEARARFAAGREALAIYTGGALDMARRNLSVTLETYRLGQFTLSDVNLERRRLLEFESAYTDTLFEVFQADTARRRAEGVIR
jgi:cobalt-zinc-cadmium efflux system outer membrane protein